MDGGQGGRGPGVMGPMGLVGGDQGVVGPGLMWVKGQEVKGGRNIVFVDLFSEDLVHVGLV